MQVKLSARAVYTMLFGILLLVAYARNRHSMPGLIVSDTEGYYMYLPAVLIQHDVHHVQERTMNARRNENGEVVMKYTCGVALFYLPFFLAAHGAAHLLHYDTSGFSMPYYYGIMLCGVFWAVVGIALLYKLLRQHFSNKTAVLTTLCICAGTNYFFYSTKWMGMSHIYSFVLVTCIALLLRRYYQHPRLIRAALIGALIGWLVLIRPTNIVLVLFFLLIDIKTIAAFKSRVRAMLNRPKDIIVAIVCAAIVFTPQLLYWKEMTGHWVHYSYAGETFMYWGAPKVAAVLFDTQNGLFVYAPILLLSFAGVFIKDERSNTVSVLPVWLIATYVFASWWAWWFGAAYGHRCYIELLPLLALPMATAIEKTQVNGKILKQVTYSFIAIAVIYNIGLTHVFDKTGAMWDGPQWRWNWELWWSMVKQIV